MCRLLGPHPNCYTYSKRMAESLVSEYAHRLPLSVARPSIGKCLYFIYLFIKPYINIIVK